MTPQDAAQRPPDAALEALERWLRRSGTRRMFARALGGGDKPNDTYLRMATTVLDKVATEVTAKPWAAPSLVPATPAGGLREALRALLDNMWRYSLEYTYPDGELDAEEQARAALARHESARTKP